MGPAVPLGVKLVHPLPWHLSILKPVSLLELSFQVSCTWLASGALAASSEGAAGRVVGAAAASGTNGKMSYSDAEVPAGKAPPQSRTQREYRLGAE